MKETIAIIGINIILLFTLNVYASHNRGGALTYKHIAGLTYEATIVTYTDIGPFSQADRESLIISWGDGSTDSVARITTESLGFDLQKNTYTGVHAYSGIGYYTLSMIDPNRTANILNIPSSDNHPFYLESELIISPFAGGGNNSVDFLSPPILFAVIGQPFVQNLTAYDVDGDLLSFELVASKGINGQNISGYTFPNNSSIDILNGELVWDAPQGIGSYTFTVKVSECRSGIQVGSALMDFQVNVIGTATGGQFQGVSNWQMDSNGHYSDTIDPGDSIELSLIYTDALSSSVDLTAYGEPFDSFNNGSFLVNSSSTGSISKTFRWTPFFNDLNCTPIITTFRGNSITSNIDTDITLVIYLRGQTVTNCAATCTHSQFTSIDENKYQKKVVEIAPNPFDTRTSITIANPNDIGKTTFVLYNTFGQQVRSLFFNSNGELLLERDQLPSGIYVYRIEGGKTGLIAMDKLIIN